MEIKRGRVSLRMQQNLAVAAAFRFLAKLFKNFGADPFTPPGAQYRHAANAGNRFIQDQSSGGDGVTVRIAGDGMYTKCVVGIERIKLDFGWHSLFTDEYRETDLRKCLAMMLPINQRNGEGSCSTHVSEM